MKHSMILTAAAAALTTLPAHADPRSGGDWTGFYVGGQVGWMEVEYPTRSPAVPGGVLYDGNGSAFGFHAGYNHDFGDFVLGGEVSVDFPSVDIDITPTGRPAPREVDYFAVAKFKAGYDAGRFLPYAVIGYASQDFKDTGALAAGSQTFDGVAYGVGVNYRVGPNLIAGVEALWFDLDPSNTSFLTSEGTMLSLRLSYKF